MPSNSEAAILAVAVCATACVGWFSAVDGWFEPWLWRLVGRMLGVRIESVCTRVGLLRIRTWVPVPLNHAKRFKVVMIGTVTIVVSALVPAVAMAVLAAHLRVSPSWGATLTLMSVLICPVGLAARVLGEPNVD